MSESAPQPPTPTSAESQKPGPLPTVRVMRPRVARPVMVAPNTSRRDTIIAVLCGALLLGAILFAINYLHDQQGLPSTNELRGTIVAKHDAGEREQEISVLHKGRRGLQSEETDSGYSFTIRVEKEQRTYEVPVNEGLYRSRKIGEQQSFMRPPSEQR